MGSHIPSQFNSEELKLFTISLLPIPRSAEFFPSPLPGMTRKFNSIPLILQHRNYFLLAVSRHLSNQNNAGKNTQAHHQNRGNTAAWWHLVQKNICEKLSGHLCFLLWCENVWASLLVELCYWVRLLTLQSLSFAMPSLMLLSAWCCETCNSTKRPYSALFTINIFSLFVWLRAFSNRFCYAYDQASL